MPNIRAIDLCSGAGGWACAARDLPIDVVMAVDFWDTACKTYKLNFPATDVVCGDLRDPAVRDRVLALASTVDLVVGGIPCEWLSVYRNVGHAKTRVTNSERIAQPKTLRSVLSLVKALAPRWWCLEDVKQLARELPNGTPYVEIDAADFSAQRRKRIYVGRFPIPKPVAWNQEFKMQACLRNGPYRIGRRTFGRRPATTNTFRAETFLGAYPDKKAPTICAISSRRDAEMAIVDPDIPGGVRQMEWQEAAELQGFPPNFVFYGSPTDCHVMVGRAIQIDTGRAILEAIVNEWAQQ